MNFLESDKRNPILLHACCAPCSAAVIEWLLANDWLPTIYFFNPNIYPEQEYLIRKNELLRYIQQQGLKTIDADYDHPSWCKAVAGYENEPERGQRCALCFKIRMTAAAQTAAAHKIPVFATTLASSRWKDIEQINSAGNAAAALFPTVRFFAKNWRTGGLTDRRAELLRQNGFYNQNYCGCEFSIRK